MTEENILKNIPRFSDFFREWKENQIVLTRIEQGLSDFKEVSRDKFDGINSRLDKINGSVAKHEAGFVRFEEHCKQEEEYTKTNKERMWQIIYEVGKWIIGALIFIAGIVLAKLGIFNL